MNDSGKNYQGGCEAALLFNPVLLLLRCKKQDGKAA